MISRVKIIRPAGRESEDFLSTRLPLFGDQGIEVGVSSTTPDPNWPYASSSYEQRLRELTNALADKNLSYLWCARGGYGASDLLEALPWKELKKKPQQNKMLIGYSDISALHSAFYAKLNWVGLHAQMPATSLWPTNQMTQDLTTVFAGIKTGHFGASLAVESITKQNKKKNSPKKNTSLTGTLFGGCFSVITNLIGTPFFPKSLKNHILFFEDTGENPGRLMRQFNQWIHSNVLKGVKALVLGNFRDCAPAGSESLYIYQQFANRTEIPTFICSDFGHIPLNMPLMVGASGKIQADGQGQLQLNWQYQFVQKISKRKT